MICEATKEERDINEKEEKKEDEEETFNNTLVYSRGVHWSVNEVNESVSQSVSQSVSPKKKKKERRFGSGYNITSSFLFKSSL